MVDNREVTETLPTSALGDLSDREQELVETARQGTALVCGNLALDDLSVSKDVTHLVRAELIRELLLGRRGQLDPRGVQIAGALVTGHLDLDHVAASVGLRLTCCVVAEAITAHDAHLPWIDMSRSRIHSLSAPQLQVDGQLLLAGVRTTRASIGGAVCLLEARVGGQLVLDDAEIINDAGPAVHADRLRTDNGLRVVGARIKGSTERGAIRLLEARIGGQIDFKDAEITNHMGAALQADGLHAASGLRLAGAHVTGSGDGAIRLVGAHVGGALDLGDSEVTNNTGPVLHADGLHADSSLRLANAHMVGSGELGAIRLVGTRIGGQVDGDNVEIVNDVGTALYADRLQADGGLRLDGARVTGAGRLGAVRLVRARFGGQFDLDNAEITNYTGPALHADGLHVDSALRLVNGRMIGAAEHGTVRLLDAHVGGQLIVDNAKITNDTGPALVADRLYTDSDVRLASTRITGAGERGTIRLPGAHIGRQLDLKGAEIINPTGAAMDIRVATVGTTVVLDAAVICPEPTRRTTCPHQAQVRLSGLTFNSLARLQWWEWLHIIRCHTPAYRPGPYQQLAGVERAAGHDGNARQILITQQQDLHQRAPEALGGWWTRRFHWLWGTLAGYGYRVRRTAVALLLALVAAGALGFWAGQVTGHNGHRAAERTTTFTNQTGQSCSTVELIGVGLDRGLPLSPTGVRARCDLNPDTNWGQAFTVAIWLLQAAVWGLATLALAGYTSLIRKTS